MRIIKLNAIDSTNSFLRQLSANERLDDYTIAVTDFQTNGRGQMGTTWNSQERKNLIVSVFKDLSFLKITDSFYTSIVVSLSILKALELLQIKKLKIKWPNDILSDNKKIVGILIENVIKQNHIQGSIIGFGVNINQTEFTDLPNASSLRLITGKVFELDEVLNEILKQLQFHFELLQSGHFKQLKTEYEQRLFRKNKPSTFKNMEGILFSGIIKGVSDYGHLQIAIESGEIKAYDLKTITLLY